MTGWQRGLVILALAAMTFVAYWPVVARGGFVWDDDAHVTANPTLRSLEGLRRIWFEPRSIPQYYPLTHTTFWLEFRAFGSAPRGYHVTNVLLHALNAVLLGWLLERLRVRGAFLAAALFALHPVHVESVAWISERKNVLSAAFFLLSFHAAVGSFVPRAPEDPDRIRSTARYVVALILYALALLGKTVTCSLPAVWLLVEVWKRGRVSLRAVLRTVPFLALGVVAAGTTAWLEREHVRADFDFSIADRILIASRALGFYAGKLLWPAGLAFSYPRWNLEAVSAMWRAAPLVVVAVITGLFAARRRIGRGPLIAGLAFAGMLVPALGFIDVYPMRFSFVADHFLYLASAPFLAAVAALLVRWPRAAVIPVAATILVALGALTWRQAEHYEGPESLWRHTLEQNPSSWMAGNNLGLWLLEQGRADDALATLRRASEIPPDRAEVLLNLGLAQLAVQRGDAGATFARAAAAEANDSVTRHSRAKAHYNLGNLLRENGDPAGALVELGRALDLEPVYAEPHLSAGHALVALGRINEALTRYDAALELSPDLVPALVGRGIALRRAERPAEAATALARALTLAPNDPSVRTALGALAWKTNRRADALPHYRFLVARNVEALLPRLRLAWCLATAPSLSPDDRAEAVRQAEDVVRRTVRRNVEALESLAAAHASTGAFARAVETAREARRLAEDVGRPTVDLDRIAQRIELYRTERPLIIGP